MEKNVTHIHGNADDSSAGVIIAVLVLAVLAFIIGYILWGNARPAPSPSPTPTTITIPLPSVTPTPAPTLNP